MIDLANIQARDPVRAEHNALIEQFLAKGGQIQKLEHVERAPIRQAVWNGTITTNKDNRRAYLKLERLLAEHGRALAKTGLTAAQAAKQLRKRWGDRVSIGPARVEQIAAKYGYSYRNDGRL